MSEQFLIPFRYVINKTADGSSSQDLESDQVPLGYAWTVEHVLCRDVDNALTRIRVLVGGDGEEYPVCEQDDPTADTAYWYTEEVTLYEGDRLVARFVGATSGDALIFALRGHKVRRLG